MRISIESIRVHSVFLGLLALASMPFPGHADIAIRDNGSGAGDLTLDGGDWSAVLRKQPAELVLTSGGEAVRIIPFTGAGVEPEGIVSCETVNTGTAGQAEVHATFSAQGKNFDARFHLTGKGTLRITPGEGMGGVYVRGRIAVGILPGIRLEDVLYVPDKYPNLDEVHVPDEGWFAGLLEGNSGIVACAWPAGAQTVSLLPENGGATRLFGALKIALDGKEMYLELLAGPRIWWKESLQPAYLEKNVELDWKRPYPATYKTQLLLRGETTTLRTFLFQKKPNEQYRPEVGACAWPVWFEGERAFMRLGKKIPPRGEAILYPMDNGDKTLMGFISRTPMADLIAKQNERAELPRGPRNAANVGFVACGGTKVMRQTIFALGVQKREKEFLSEYADFLADYVAIVQQRNVAAFRFVDETRGQLEAWAKEQNNDPEAGVYIAKMMEQAKVLEQGMRIKMELYGDDTPEQHMAHADRAAQRLKELLDTGDPEVYPECEELIDTCNILAWGHAEVAGMRFSMLAREWAQQAALECVAIPKAIEYAQTIRAAVRTALNGSSPW
ncbi:MAG TPA: hypothetical protein VMZ06_16070 [Candidatus Bathyarchaeia archaeon]|nr:hypothetical protein [Candidatus Bathyarchaeia archaeon]